MFSNKTSVWQKKSNIEIIISEFVLSYYNVNLSFKLKKDIKYELLKPGRKFKNIEKIGSNLLATLPTKLNHFFRLNLIFKSYKAIGGEVNHIFYK